VVRYIEDQIDILTKEAIIINNFSQDIEYGIAFPVGINLNNIAAHWSPLFDECCEYIKTSDVVTLDYGIHFDGYIIDAAMTFAYDNKYRDLLECGIRSTQTTVDIVYEQMMKTGRVNIYDLSTNIINHIKSSGFESMWDLCGHQITRYKIHDGIVVPNINLNLKQKIIPGQIFTIEPFVSTGTGKSKHRPNEISHVMFNYAKHKFDINKIPDFLKPYKTLAFNIRNFTKEQKTLLNKLIKKQIYLPYAPILDEVDTSIVCQYETTIYIKSRTEIFNYKKHKPVDYYIILNV
jgi:methionyl aminopeptidase